MVNFKEHLMENVLVRAAKVNRINNSVGRKDWNVCKNTPPDDPIKD